MKTFLKHMMIHLLRSDAVFRFLHFFQHQFERHQHHNQVEKTFLGQNVPLSFWISINRIVRGTSIKIKVGALWPARRSPAYSLGRRQNRKKQRGSWGAFWKRRGALLGKRYPNIQVFILKINSQLSVCRKGTKMELIQLTLFVDILADRQDIFLHSKQLNDTSLEPQGCLQTECFYCTYFNWF